MEKNETGRFGSPLRIGDAIKNGMEKRREDKLRIVTDAAVVLLGFLFSRCHVAFGVYPLAIAFLAALPSGVWLSLIGVAVGSFSLGDIGIINAIISIVVVLLRIIISGGDRRDGGALFSESLIFRVAASTIGAFIGAIYELLLRGFAAASILYGTFFVLSAALFTVLLAGLFYTNVTPHDLLTSRESVFSREGEKKTMHSLLFEASMLLYIFLISLSLKNYNFLGISMGYVFSAFITLLSARRFDAVRAMAVGFVSSLPLSGIYSVAFALAGLGAGIVFELGALYAFVAGGVLLSAFSAYVGGALGFLSTFPEYAIASMLSLPIIRRLSPMGREVKERENVTRAAEDMVSAVALAYRGQRNGETRVTDAMTSCARVLSKVSEHEGRLSLYEYRDTVISSVSSFCPTCPAYSECLMQTPAPCVEFAEIMSTKLYKGERLSASEAQAVPSYCRFAQQLFSKISEEASKREREREFSGRIGAIADEYELIARLINESKRHDECESTQDKILTERISEAAFRSGLVGGAVRVLGERRPHFIIAGEDKDGSVITSSDFHHAIEEAAGFRLASHEYFRRGDIALLECSAALKYSVEFYATGKNKAGEAASGDAAMSVDDVSGHFISLISDGMGSGEEARATSQLTAELLFRFLRTDASRNTVLHVINHLLKSRRSECSTTVDLFDFDLVTGEAVFYKCGAAPSYVKRGSSIFRIKSETAPLGIARSIDAERIRVEVKEGDTVVMISDGVSNGIEDGAWLLEILSKPMFKGVKEYAEMILFEAERRNSLSDDTTVAVAKIIRREE